MAFFSLCFLSDSGDCWLSEGAERLEKGQFAPEWRMFVAEKKVRVSFSAARLLPLVDIFGDLLVVCVCVCHVLGTL